MRWLLEPLRPAGAGLSGVGDRERWGGRHTSVATEALTQQGPGPTRPKRTLWSQWKDISPDLGATRSPQMLPEPQSPCLQGLSFPPPAAHVLSPGHGPGLGLHAAAEMHPATLLKHISSLAEHPLQTTWERLQAHHTCSTARGGAGPRKGISPRVHLDSGGSRG